MDFDYKDEHYRLERGTGTQTWLLLHRADDGRVGWRLSGSYDRTIKESAIVQFVKDDLDREEEVG